MTAADGSARRPGELGRRSAARLTTKRAVLLLLATPTLVLLLASTRTWVTGRSTDPVLGPAAITATGSQVAPGVVALGAVALAALVALLTGGLRIRRLSAALLVLAAAGATVLTVLVLADPAAALGRFAAPGLGRTGTVATTATALGWSWVATVSGVILAAAGVLAFAAAGRWQGLPSRFESPQAAKEQGGRGTRRTAWDDLSEGQDPTLDGDRPAGPGAGT